jgi:hypothetical protein
MPDLVAHLASACVATVPFRDRRTFRVLVYVGALLPDLATRSLVVTLENVTPRAYLLAMPMHTPVGFLVLCLLLTQLWRDRGDRRRALLALLAGGALHFGLDLLQGHVTAAYFWLFPFSWSSFELALFHTEASVEWLPVTLAVVVFVEAWGALRDRRRDRSP